MKAGLSLFGVVIAPIVSLAGSLPFITIHPTNQVVAPGSDTILFVASTNATSYQWRCNGVDIPWGTSSTLVITNAQSTNNGYYMALAKNETGWTPSAMGFLSIVGNALGWVPFSNNGNVNARADYPFVWCVSGPITNGRAQLVAGPALDWMQPVEGTLRVNNGYYPTVGSAFRYVPTVAPGQDVYYRVDIVYTNNGCYWISNTQPSTTLKLVAAGDTDPAPSVDSLRFPIYIEWPPGNWLLPPTNKFVSAGETITLQVGYYSVTGNSLPIQWRKDGRAIPGATNSIWTTAILTLTNVQASDTGIYDLLLPLSYGPPLSSKFTLTVQTAGGGGVLLSPRRNASIFACDLEGIPGRTYSVLWTTNLVNWTQLGILTNTTGTSTFTDSLGGGSRYYRTLLLP